MQRAFKNISRGRSSIMMQCSKESSVKDPKRSTLLQSPTGVCAMCDWWRTAEEILEEIIRLCSIKREYKSTTQRVKTARGERLHIFSTYSMCASWGHVICQRWQKQTLLNFFSAYTHTFLFKSILAASLIMIKTDVKMLSKGMNQLERNCVQLP